MFQDDVARHYRPVHGYLNTATAGLPAVACVEALRGHLDDWANGLLQPAGFDTDVLRCRSAFAELVGTTTERVAMPGAVSLSAGLVASSLPAGANVLCAEEDFTSVLFPFLADDRLSVTTVPFDRLLDAVDADTDMIAVSAVQSSDGRVIDLDSLAQISAANGCKVFLDVTQAAGWLPLEAHRFDIVACSAYKWLSAPRGIGFLVVRDDVDWLVPRFANWYAGERPWESIYRPPLRLATDARRFTVSPAWFDVAATAEALEALLAIGLDRIHRHDVELANRLLAALCQPPTNSAIVSLTTRTDPAADLSAAGMVTASRDGRTRLSFHLTNTVDEADRAAELLRTHL